MEQLPTHKTPEMKYDFFNGVIVAKEDMPFLGVKKGEKFQPKFDGTYWFVGSLTWDVKKLTEEIDDGIWSFEKTS